ncbi:protein turtle homolog A-like [Rhinoraja longicauda]
MGESVGALVGLLPGLAKLAICGSRCQAEEGSARADCRPLLWGHVHAWVSLPKDHAVSTDTMGSPLSPSTPPAVLEVGLGEPVLLVCQVDGVPEPVVRWWKDGREMPAGGARSLRERVQVGGGVLEIPSTGVWSRGLYTCEAASDQGSIKHSTSLHVIGPPVILQAPQNTTINMTQDAEFECEAEAYPANVTYTWSKHRVNVQHIRSVTTTAPGPASPSVRTVGREPGAAGGDGYGQRLVHLHRQQRGGRVASSHCLPLCPAPSLHLADASHHRPRLGAGGSDPVPVCLHPPLSHVSWSKDGHSLPVAQVPGWSVAEDGAILIAVVDNTASGVYSCTPYNSLGTLGNSTPTHIILKDPPKFVVRPAASYRPAIGQELRIGCTATGDPWPRVSWSKPGEVGAHYRVLGDGTLVLGPVSPLHHGLWECVASSNVSQITTNTWLQVTGTSPHPPTRVTLGAGSFGVNISWSPGFDGGHQQHFSVWFQQVVPQPHDWIFQKVPLGAHWLWVAGLWPDTCYQFSVLAQSERGSSPFTEILSACTQSVPVATSPPRTPVLEQLYLLPPSSLKANRTQRGILLHWEAPLPSSLPPTAYLLESWEGSGWRLMHSAIPAIQEELLLRGLVKDSHYLLRLRSRRGEQVSVAGRTVNVSTQGMVWLPPQEGGDGSVRAGVIAGGCFLLIAVTVSVLVACAGNQRRARRRHEVPIMFSHFQTSPESRYPDSPDSVLKLKALVPVYETFSGVSHSPGAVGAGGDRALSARLQGIRRGPDGRFAVDPGPSPGALAFPKRGEGRLERWGHRLESGQTSTPLASNPAGESRPVSTPGLSPIHVPPGPSLGLPRSLGPGLRNGTELDARTTDTGILRCTIPPHPGWQDLGLGVDHSPGSLPPPPPPNLASPTSRCAALWAEFQEVRGAGRGVGGSWRGGNPHRSLQQATLL